MATESDRDGFPLRSDSCHPWHGRFRVGEDMQIRIRAEGETCPTTHR